MQNKRQEMRIACNKSVQVIMATNTSISMTVLNYSMRGICISGSIYHQIPLIGEQLSVSFILNTMTSRQVDINGVVKYINLDGGVYYMGVGSN